MLIATEAAHDVSGTLTLLSRAPSSDTTVTVNEATCDAGSNQATRRSDGAAPNLRKGDDSAVAWADCSAWNGCVFVEREVRAGMFVG